VFLVPPISALLDRETKDAIYLASGQGERSMFDFLEEAEQDVLYNTVDLLVDKLHELTSEGRLDEAKYIAEHLYELGLR
jgi:dTDP-4-dehydrorhamnose reductase